MGIIVVLLPNFHEEFQTVSDFWFIICFASSFLSQIIQIVYVYF